MEFDGAEGLKQTVPVNVGPIVKQPIEKSTEKTEEISVEGSAQKFSAVADLQAQGAVIADKKRLAEETDKEISIPLQVEETRALVEKEILSSAELSSSKNKAAKLPGGGLKGQKEKLDTKKLEAMVAKMNSAIKTDIDAITEIIKNKGDEFYSNSDILNRNKLILKAYNDLYDRVKNVALGEGNLKSELFEKILSYNKLLGDFTALGQKNKSVHDFAKNTDDEEQRDVGADGKDDLNDKVLKEIEAVDNALLRKYLESKNREEASIVFGFLELSPREKLMAYASIEQEKVKEMNSADILHSQNKYHPNVEKIISKLERYSISKKFRTSTIDVSMLCDAKRSVISARPTIEYAKKMDKKMAEFKDSNDGRLDKLEDYSRMAEIIYRDLRKLSVETMGYKEMEIKERLTKNIASLHKMYQELNLDDVGKEEFDVKVYDDDIDLGLASKTKKTVLASTALKNILAPINALADSKGIALALSGAGAAAAGLSALLLIPAALGYAKDFTNMTSVERGLKFVDIFAGQTSLSFGGLSSVAGGLLGSGLCASVGVGLSLTAGAINLTVGLAEMKGADYQESRLDRAMSGFKRAQKTRDKDDAYNKRQAKYEDNLAKLSSRIITREKVGSSFKMVSATLSMTAGLTSVAPGGAVAGAFMAAGAFSLTILGKITDGIMKKRSYSKAIDEFLGLDELAAEQYPYKSEEKKKDTDAKRSAYKSRMHKEVLALKGYKNSKQYVAAIMKVYANHIYNKLFGADKAEGDERIAYLNYARSINLKVREGKRLPSPDMIFNKLMA